MQPMKRSYLFFLGVLIAIILSPLDMGRSGGGVELSRAYAFDMAVGKGGPVCVAFQITPVKPLPKTAACPAGEVPNDPASGGAIIYYLKQILFVINGLIGGIIMLVIVVAGIQYITSVGEPASVKSAKKRLMNATTALVMYLMMVAILNFLIPGGVL
jgi:hypothetical protein